MNCGIPYTLLILSGHFSNDREIRHCCGLYGALEKHSFKSGIRNATASEPIGSCWPSKTTISSSPLNWMSSPVDSNHSYEI